MADGDLTTGLVIRQASIDDIPAIDALDRYNASPFRNIHQDLQKYFGSLDPSQHERNLIFVAEVAARLVGKAELVMAPATHAAQVGYVFAVLAFGSLPDAREVFQADKSVGMGLQNVLTDDMVGVQLQPSLSLAQADTSSGGAASAFALKPLWRRA